VATSRSPALRRRRLAAELRRLRGDRPGHQVARGLGWSTSKVSRYELGRSTLPLDEVEKMLDFYGVTDPERGQLLSLAREANERGWWEEYADALPDEYQTFIGLEAEAASAAIWEVEIVPGLLQSEDYARQVHLGYQAVVPIPPGIIDTRVKVRMIRQQILTRDPPLELSVVLDESVLLRPIGKNRLMYGQLQHLLRMADLPNVELRVLPLSRQRLVANSFTIFGFNPIGETGGLRDVVNTESTVGSDLYVEGETDTYFHRLVFQSQLDASVSPHESQVLIREIAEQRWADRLRYLRAPRSQPLRLGRSFSSIQGDLQCKTDSLPLRTESPVRVVPNWTGPKVP
jgi:transcriptional regulator with XRE-family HTH domain